MESIHSPIITHFKAALAEFVKSREAGVSASQLFMGGDLELVRRLHHALPDRELIIHDQDDAKGNVEAYKKTEALLKDKTKAGSSLQSIFQDEELISELEKQQFLMRTFSISRLLRM